jgi:xylulokinase
VDPVYVGLDLGTSSLKAVAVDAGGSVVASASSAYETYRPEPGAAEQDPQDWFRAVREVVAELRSRLPVALWAGIGLSAMIPTLVPTDFRGEPFGRAITWQDGRAELYGEQLRTSFGGTRLYELTGQWVDGRYLVPMSFGLAERQRRSSGTSRWQGILGAKDLLFGWLTGTPATDPSTAAGYGCYDLVEAAWSTELLAAAPSLLMASLPPVLPSTTARPLTAARAADLGLAAGLPVVLGAADSALGAYGLGVTEPGDVAYLAGTSTVVLGVSPELVRDHRHRFLVTPLGVGSGWGLEMDLLSTGAAVEWLARLTGASVDVAGLVALADTVDPAAPNLPVFLPYLAPGEQGALWDPTLTGAVTGLDLSHGRAELARALVNGILVESRRCLSVLETASGGAGTVRLAGRTTAGRFAQDLADASGRPVVRAGSGPRADSASALGAALLARLALAYQPGSSVVGDAVDAMAAPEPARAAAWASIADRHDAVLRAVRTTGTPSRGAPDGGTR